MTYPATGPNTTARPIRPTDADAMIFRLFRRRFHPATIYTLYGVIVAQARWPEFYEEFGVADTVDGRFDLIVLHLVLVLRRLDAGAARCGARAAPWSMRFGRDMDHNLREMGVGDLAVPKQMKRMMEAFYGRARSYAGALWPGPIRPPLERALARNVFGGDGAAGRGAARRLCAPCGRAIGCGASVRNSCAAGLLFPTPTPFWPAKPIQPEFMAFRISA